LTPARAAQEWCPIDAKHVAYTLESRPFESLGDLAWNARVEASHGLAAWRGTLAALLGLSFGYGPNGTGADADTAIYGVDLHLKWRPDTTDAGWPFVAWQTELLWRDYEAAAQADPVALPASTRASACRSTGTTSTGSASPSRARATAPSASTWRSASTAPTSDRLRS
jgi:hypothetical protein